MKARPSSRVLIRVSDVDVPNPAKSAERRVGAEFGALDPHAGVRHQILLYNRALKHSMPYMWTGRVVSRVDQLFGGFGAVSKCERETDVQFGPQRRDFVRWAPGNFTNRSECLKSERGNVSNGGKRRGLQKCGEVRIFWCNAQKGNEEAEGGTEFNCLYLRRTVKNGELIEHSGPVVVCGDVEPRGHVLADGDVTVLGRLQGHVHAGRSGTAASKIFASVMEARELRISDSALFCPKDDGAKDVAKTAVFLPGGEIRIQRAVNVSEKEVETQELSIPRSQSFKQGQRETQLHSSARDSPLKRISRDRGTSNEKPARVALATGIYISVAGIALLGFPKLLFGILFDLRGVAQGWVQVGAILAVVFGVYYIGTAIGDMRGQNGARAFYFSTVVGRIFLFLSFLGLVVIGAVPRPLLLVGGVNLVGALLMLNALLKGSLQ